VNIVKNFRFHKWKAVSTLAERPLASEEKCCCVYLLGSNSFENCNEEDLYEAAVMRNVILQHHIVCKTMFIIVQSTQFSIDILYITRLLLYVSAYNGHHRVHTVFYTHPYFCLLYLPVLASVYTLGVCCSGTRILFM
jgi:hypothetical protein